MSLDIDALALSLRGEALRFSVRTTPRASKTAVLGVREGALALALAAGYERS